MGCSATLLKSFMYMLFFFFFFFLRGSHSTEVQDLLVINFDSFPIYMYIFVLSYVNRIPISATSSLLCFFFIMIKFYIMGLRKVH